MDEPDTGSSTGRNTPSKPSQTVQLASSRRGSRCASRNVFVEPNASLVLIGIKGTGKSSLGILAATAYNWRLLDAERAFYEETGKTVSTYRKDHGNEEYQQRHDEFLGQLLTRNDKSCIIVLSLNDLEGRGIHILNSYRLAHPVVHILRDAKGIHSYVQVWTLDQVRSLQRVGGPLLRASSNFDFFNLSVGNGVESDGDGDPSSSVTSSNVPSYLILKHVEQAFLQFLTMILGEPNSDSQHQIADPLSQLPVERRLYTHSALVDTKAFLSGNIDIETAQIGADAIELSSIAHRQPAPDPDLQLTPDLIALAYATARKTSTLPIILTFPAVKGLSTQDRLESFQNCLRLAPDFCTIDLALTDVDLARLNSSKGRTKLIASHDFDSRPSDGWLSPLCKKIHERATRSGCDVVKITMPAIAMTDFSDLQTFRQEIEALPDGPSLIAYNTGALGRLSMCFNPIMTPVSPVQSLKPEQNLYGQLYPPTAKELTAVLFTISIHEPARFVIYGTDVSWSLSPAMHSAAFEACGMSHAVHTRSSPTLDELVALTRDEDFGGASVVQPHKTSVIALLTSMSKHARAIGAVNTVIAVRELSLSSDVPPLLEIMAQRHRRGPVKALYGDNTDWIGIRTCLRQGLSPANAVRPNSTSLVCGAGGMARAAVYALISIGVRNIFIYNRTEARAQALAAHYNQQLDDGSITTSSMNGARTRVHVIESLTLPWPKEYRYATMIVCTIPAESAAITEKAEEKGGAFTLSPEWLKSPTGGVAIELSYKPLVTPLVQQIRAEAQRGWMLVNGLHHLQEQAFVQFELFSGRRAPKKLMREVLVRHYSRDQVYFGYSK